MNVGHLQDSKTDIGRGVINDNFLAALVTSKAYRQQIVIAKKGKGSFKRKAKYKGQEPYLMAA
ncbi:alternative ribosome rescue factor ArfA [Colwelliaceae bacterium 6441]